MLLTSIAQLDTAKGEAAPQASDSIEKDATAESGPQSNPHKFVNSFCDFEHNPPWFAHPTPKMPRPSQKLIAQKLGISTATVSLALRGKGTISQKLAAEVKAMAESMGYRPNPILASLASKRFSNVSDELGIPVVMIDFLKQNIGTQLYPSRLGEWARKLGYAFTSISARELANYNKPSQTLHNRGVHGIILVGPIKDTEFRDNFDWSLFSVIQCGRFLEPLPFDTVRPNIFQSIKLAYHKATARGYRRIGFALGRHDPILEDDESRLSAALGLQQIEEPDNDRIPPYFGQLKDRAAFLDWVKTHQPDCVIGFHVGQCAALVENGFRVPEDLGFASLHLEGPKWLGDKRNLKIAGNDQNFSETVLQSVMLLDQKIKYHERGLPQFPKHVLIPSSWIEGETLPDRNQ